MAKAKPIGYVDLTFELVKEGRKWTARCLELGTAGDGDSLDEAFEIIRDLVTLHLNALEDVAARNAFFKKHGIVLHKGTPSQKPQSVTVPPNRLVARVAQPIQVAVA